jgi:hypothetical protein
MTLSTDRAGSQLKHEELQREFVEQPGWDRDRVTKRFYDRFKSEHAAFVESIKGISDQGDRDWYAALMLTRLMFVYFMQRKGFLDGEVDYLGDRLGKVQARRVRGKRPTYYRYFLVALFHEGFATAPPDRQLDVERRELLGTVPYLDGGLFDVHPLEERHPKLDISDEAFARLLGFFHEWDWRLDAGPLRNDCEINPDVLGYIFEKYINQKQMGAYYTKEDITEYIAKNTIIPYLLDAARQRCASCKAILTATSTRPFARALICLCRRTSQPTSATPGGEANGTSRPRRNMRIRTRRGASTSRAGNGAGSCARKWPAAASTK